MSAFPTGGRVLNYVKIAVLVADSIRDKLVLPTFIGILGSWGIGKSSLLRDDPATRDAIIVRFDA